MDADQFKRVEDEYFRLKGLLAAGRITPEQFEVALKELPFQDAEGRYWMIGADSGKWYLHNGVSWVEANPFPPPAPRKSPLLFVGVMLILVVLAGGLFFAWSQGLVKIGGWATAPSPTHIAVASPTLLSVAVNTTAATSTNTPTPMATETTLPTATLTEQAAATLTPTTTTATPVATLSATLPPPTLTPTTPPPTPTRRVLTFTPSPMPTVSASPTAALPPGVYVTNVRSDPAQPLNLQHIQFYATFVNTTGGTPNYRWCVEIWDPNDSKKSFGVTECRFSDTIPGGTNERPTLDNSYRIVRGGTCLPLRARAIWITSDNARVPFVQPDGSTFWYNFQVCPA